MFLLKGSFGSLTLYHLTSSSQGHYIISRKASDTIRCYERDRPLSHNFHYNIVTGILLLLVTNLSRCIIRELNFIANVHIQTKTVYTRCSAICSFRHLMGVLEYIPSG